MVDEFCKVGLSARHLFFHQFSILKTIFSTLSSAPKFFSRKRNKIEVSTFFGSKPVIKKREEKLLKTFFLFPKSLFLSFRWCITSLHSLSGCCDERSLHNFAEQKFTEQEFLTETYHWKYWMSNSISMYLLTADTAQQIHRSWIQRSVLICMLR